MQAYNWPLGIAKNDNRDLSARKIWLIADILIGGQQ